MKLKLKLKLILFSAVLMSCHFNSSRINSEKDKSDGELVTKEFYKSIKLREYEEASKLFSEDFFKVATKDKLMELLVKTNEKLGDLDSVSLDSWDTRVIEGTDAASEYSFTFKNRYDRFEATETIRLKGDKDGIIRIINYHINSEGFLQ